MSSPIQVLLVEDNPGDARLTRIALEDGKMHVNLSVVDDGVEAMAFLRRQAAYTDSPHPDLILLDLNLPKKDGREVLAEIKADHVLKRIPVVILTTSQAEEDIIRAATNLSRDSRSLKALSFVQSVPLYVGSLRAYSLSANCYISKPVDFDQFIKIVQSIEDFWFTIVKLPPE